MNNILRSKKHFQLPLMKATTNKHRTHTHGPSRCCRRNNNVEHPQSLNNSSPQTSLVVLLKPNSFAEKSKPQSISATEKSPPDNSVSALLKSCSYTDPTERTRDIASKSQSKRPLTAVFSNISESDLENHDTAPFSAKRRSQSAPPKVNPRIIPKKNSTESISLESEAERYRIEVNSSLHYLLDNLLASYRTVSTLGRAKSPLQKDRKDLPLKGHRTSSNSRIPQKLRADGPCSKYRENSPVQKKCKVSRVQKFCVDNTLHKHRVVNRSPKHRGGDSPEIYRHGDVSFGASASEKSRSSSQEKYPEVLRQIPRGGRTIVKRMPSPERQVLFNRPQEFPETPRKETRSMALLFGWVFDSLLLAGVAITTHYLLVEFVDKKTPLPPFIEKFLQGVKSGAYYRSAKRHVRNVLSFIALTIEHYT